MSETAIDREERNWGMLCHLSAIAFFLIPAMGHIIGPLVVWLFKRDQYRMVEEEGKESLNFQISMTLYSVAAAITVVGLLLVPVILVVDAVLTIIAAIKTSNGEPYRYPLTIHFLK